MARYHPALFTTVSAAALILSGAATLASGEASAFAVDFTDQSLYVLDAGTPANNRDISEDLNAFSSYFTYTSPSPKMVMHSDGYIKYAAHNLCLQSSNFSGGSPWGVSGSVTVTTDAATAPDGTVTADLITANDTTAFMQQTITSITSAQYIAIMYLKAGTGTHYRVQWLDGTSSNGVRLWVNLSSGTLGTTATVGTGWSFVGTPTVDAAANGFYKLTAVFQTNNTSILWGHCTADADNSTTKVSGNTYYAWGAQLTRYPCDTTYLPTTTTARYAVPIEYNTSAVCQGFLNEPAATNLFTANTTLSSFTFNGASGAIDTVSPSSLTTATTVTGTTGSGWHGCYRQVVLAGATTFTTSVYAKAGSLNYLNMNHQGTANNYFSVVFDLSDGTIGDTAVGSSSGTLTSYSITPVGNGWYRCQVTGQIANANRFFAFGTATAKTGNTFGSQGEIVHTNAGTVKIWLPQAESGTIMTSPIQTYSATVTRAVDDFTKTYAWNHSNANGTVFIEYLLKVPTVQSTVLVLWDGTSNEHHYLIGSSGGLGEFTTDGGAAQTSNLLSSTNNVADGASHKTAFSYAANDASISTDGETAVSDTSCTMPTTDRLRFGRSIFGTAYPQYIRKVMILPRTASDAELQALTA